MVMSFFKRLAVVALAVVAISVLAALAWDGSDAAAGVAAPQPIAPGTPAR